MNKFYKFLICLLMAFILGTFITSCKKDTGTDITPSSDSEDAHIATSVELSDKDISISQSKSGNIYTFKVVLSDAFKNRDLTYEWLIDYGPIEESEHTSEDGKTFTIDVTDFPANTYFVYLGAYDKTPLPWELEDKVTDTDICYIVTTSFVVTK